MTQGYPPDRRGAWRRLSGPLKVGLVCAGLGIILALVGIGRGMVPLRPLSIMMALVISGGTWGIVSWAVATAARDVDRDVARSETQGEDLSEPSP